MNFILNRRWLVNLCTNLLGLTLLTAVVPVIAADMAADVFVKQLSDEVIDTIKADKSFQASNMVK